MTTERGRLVYKIKSANGARHVIYNAAAFGPASNFQAGKWYFLPYPAQWGMEISEPFDTAREAERAAEDCFQDSERAGARRN